ncbi:hypothetical protein [Pseudomonas moorei]|uniref:hypothetical protein n=1 Tax=Pseudomonas moorei TaxID=395599 RepID=UPI0036F19D43
MPVSFIAVLLAGTASISQPGVISLINSLWMLLFPGRSDFDSDELEDEVDMLSLLIIGASEHHFVQA